MKAFGNSDVGCTRKINEDSFVVVQNENKDWLAVVCDGIGGSAAGEVASKIAVDTLRDAFMKAPFFTKDSQISDWVHEQLNRANDSIYLESMKNKKERGMGTTCVGMVYARNATYIFNVGDSRLYAYYSDGLIQMSDDHSVIAKLIREGKITPDEAKTHAQRNTLTNALGVWRVFRIDFNKIDSNYHYVLLCSDGLCGYVSFEEIQAIVETNELSLKDKVNGLISRANQTGGFDNCTVILLENEEYSYE